MSDGAETGDASAARLGACAEPWSSDADDIGESRIVAGQPDRYNSSGNG